MKRVLHLAFFLFISFNLFAQAPQKMTYQAVIRNASNNLVVSAPVKMKISILQGSANGTAVYSELHNPTTNANGLVSIEIGSGTSPVGTIGSINWGNGTYFLKTETDPTNGTNYTISGTSQLLSVPYALQSNCVSSSLSGDTLLVGCKKYLIPGIKDLNAPPTLNNGLVAFYPFNGNANDESGNNNNGVVNGATLTSDRFGVVNKAYNFNGNSHYISVNNSASLNPTSITISAWVKVLSAPTDENAGARSIVSKWVPISNCGGEGENYNFQFSKLNNNNVVALATSLNSQLPTSLNSIVDLSNTNIWRHIVVVHDANNGQKLYVNGVLINSNNVAGSLCATTNKLLIGADNNFNVINRFFSGVIDDIRIYNRSLTQEEITYLANN
jgi:hypothetical protein